MKILEEVHKKYTISSLENGKNNDTLLGMEQQSRNNVTIERRTDRMKDIGVFFAPGFEEIEALTVVDILRRAGLPVKMISVMNQKYETGSHQITVQTDQTLEETDFEQIDMIVLPGGQPGTKNLEACEPLMKQLDIFYKEKKYISAICAAPTILGHREMLKGRKACCYPGLEAQLADAQLSYAACVTDDFITTGRGVGSAISFACAIVERYQGRASSDKLAAAVVHTG